jgi:beta-glucanase (GH16 family)
MFTASGVSYRWKHRAGTPNLGDFRRGFDVVRQQAFGPSTQTPARHKRGSGEVETRASRRLLPKATAVTAVLLGLLAASVGVSGCGPLGQAEEASHPWQVAFVDEFGGTTLNQQNWVTCDWTHLRGCTNRRGDEQLSYQPDNVTVSDGVMHLTARRVRGAGPRPDYLYTSGMVSTGRDSDNTTQRPRFAFRYGRVDARMRLPDGQGLWPALRLLPVSGLPRPEISVVETRGQYPHRIHMHFHYDGQQGWDRQHAWTGPDTSAGWHTYSVEWTPDRIQWSVDGYVQRQFSRASVVPQEPMYVDLELAVGGRWPGNPDQTTRFPSSLDVDFVRIWQRTA